MNSKRIKSIVLPILVLIFLSVGFLSCQNPFTWYQSQQDEDGLSDGQDVDGLDGDEGDETGDDPADDLDASKISLQGTSFTLAWDPPADEDVSTYRVYFRFHGDEEWIELDEIDGATTHYTVTYPDLDYGEYDFAVTSLNNEEESDYHTSLDSTAMPETGWFLDWRES